jgi:hypothetical protein
VGGVGTFVVSLITACLFLHVRCRKIGRPFGPRARPWAIFIVTGTALLSTALGLVILAASQQPPAAYLGILVPGGLWIAGVTPRDRTGWLTRPLGRLYDSMGEDMQAWCDVRRRAAAERPQWISDAVQYYAGQVEGQLKDRKARTELRRWRESIVHKISIVRLISLDTTETRLRDSLQRHASTRHIGKYSADDLPRLALRLETEALNELNLYLAYVYRLGHHRLLIYPFRPSVHRTPREDVPRGRREEMK